MRNLREARGLGCHLELQHILCTHFNSIRCQVSANEEPGAVEPGPPAWPALYPYLSTFDWQPTHPSPSPPPPLPSLHLSCPVPSTSQGAALMLGPTKQPLPAYKASRDRAAVEYGGLAHNMPLVAQMAPVGAAERGHEREMVGGRSGVW